MCALIFFARGGEGAGVALVPRSALHRENLKGAVVVPISGHRPTRRAFVAVRRDSENHPLIATVRDAVDEHANTDEQRAHLTQREGGQLLLTTLTLRRSGVPSLRRTITPEQVRG